MTILANSDLGWPNRFISFTTNPAGTMDFSFGESTAAFDNRSSFVNGRFWRLITAFCDAWHMLDCDFFDKLSLSSTLLGKGQPVGEIKEKENLLQEEHDGNMIRHKFFHSLFL
ncbi:hypothetical protein [Paenibacillus tyrfis]|uniref:hypothetical protein n=1 Tax=Paenibacillus tyrfis TaxID=1501230 RepID=UPI0020A1BD0B|nr:hypothetical protein [Paenibacillus tyrfis]MCP1306809.1 hypothetical protein [Paenibacillus tyrfis]